MSTRRTFLFSSVAALALGAAPRAGAFEFRPYDPAVARAAIEAGKPVIVHVYAYWCLQCHIQKSILAKLEADKTYDGVQFFRVDYTQQTDVVAALNCPRSTVIAYKGGKEVARMSWGTSEESVLNVLKAAL